MGSYAYYRIVVQNEITVNTGNVVFNFKGNNNEDLNNKTITLNEGNKVFPGNSGEFTITIDASESDVDMYATLEIDRGTLPTNLKFYTTSDKKSELHKYYSFLEKNKTNSETLTIYWYRNPNVDDTEDNKFINKSNLEAKIKVNAVQVGEYATMKNGYSYNRENVEVTSTEFWSVTYREYIRTVYFGNDLSNLPNSCTEENLCWDISESSTQNKKVYGYLVDSGLKDSTDNTKSLYNLYIVSEAPIFAPSDCSYMFYGFKNLTNVNFNNNFNTSKVMEMSYMFGGCSSLTDLDISGFNTSNIINMSFTFRDCSSLTSLNLSSFNTLKVTNMDEMFYNCSSLTSLDLGSFNTSKLTNMGYMFYGCSSLSSLDLSSFDTLNVTNMGCMFYGCSKLITEINIMSSGTTYYEDMFNGAATESGAQITINFISDASTIADNMIATKSSNSNVVKGNQL